MLLTIEEIITALLSNVDKPFANILMGVYSIIYYTSPNNIHNCIQLLYQTVIFIILLFVAFVIFDNKTFDENIKILLMPEK